MKRMNGVAAVASLFIPGVPFTKAMKGGAKALVYDNIADALRKKLNNISFLAEGSCLI